MKIETICRDRKSSVYFVIFVFVIAVAAFVRLYDLDHESLFMDEVYQVSFYELPWNKIHLGAARQQQPPLDCWIGKFAYTISPSDYSVRMPAALFGIGSVIILFWLLWRSTTPLVSIVISGIYALSPFHIYFSQDARPYSIAIFFFLVLCAAVVWLEKEKGLGLLHFLFLFFAELLFLLSRSLSPLSVFIMLNALFFLRLCVGVLHKKREFVVRNALYLCASIAVFISYLPIFQILLNASARYTSQLGLLETIVEGFRRFTLAPAFEAFIVQMEPLGYLFLPVVFIALPMLLSRFRLFEKLNIFSLSAYLIVFSTFFHVFVFVAKANFPKMPLRAPYPIYIQPLSLLLAGFVFHMIYNKWNNRKLIGTFSVLVLCLMVFATYQSKIMSHKTDWRGVSDYVNKNLTPENLVIFETLSIRDSWKPYGWGFQRYKLDVPSYPITSILETPQVLGRMYFKPVFILFYYRDYKLLPGSLYSFIPNSGGYPPIDQVSIVSNDAIKVTHYTGLVIIELKKYTDNSVRDIYNLIKEIAYQFPKNNTLVDMLLLADEMEKLCPPMKSFEPFRGVKYLFKPDDLPYIEKIMGISSSLQAVCR